MLSGVIRLYVPPEYKVHPGESRPAQGGLWGRFAARTTRPNSRRRPRSAATLRWCVNKASNVPSESLHLNHRREYQNWSRHAGSFAPALDALIAGPVSAALQDAYRTPEMTDWVRSQLTRACLECCYSPLSDVRLARDQVAWYLAGHFPCGWSVEDEAGFPNAAVAVVY